MFCFAQRDVFDLTMCVCASKRPIFNPTKLLTTKQDNNNYPKLLLISPVQKRKIELWPFNFSIPTELNHINLSPISIFLASVPHSHAHFQPRSLILMHPNLTLITQHNIPLLPVPTGSPSCGGEVAVYVFDINQLSSPTPFCSVLVSVSVLFLFSVYCSFNCISFHKFSRPLSAFSLCSSGLISV